MDSYALICPGTALFVFGMFFVHLGLVRGGMLEKFSLPYFILLAPLVLSQLYAIWTMLHLDERILRPEPQQSIDIDTDRGMAVA